MKLFVSLLAVVGKLPRENELLRLTNVYIALQLRSLEVQLTQLVAVSQFNTYSFFG